MASSEMAPKVRPCQPCTRCLSGLIRTRARQYYKIEIDYAARRGQFDDCDSMPNAPQTFASRLATWFMRRTAPSAVRRIVPLKAAVASDIGVVREDNQDRVALARGADQQGSGFILAALADGIGGMKQGAECAALTIGVFIDAVINEAHCSADPKEWLRKGAQRANLAVRTALAGDGGSTLVAILMAKDSRPLWLSVGDSRVYLASDGKVTQLSKDDTLAGQLGKVVEGGLRSELLQFIGIGDGLEPHIELVPSDSTGTLLLTSDGVHFIDASYMGKVVHCASDLGLGVRRLTELARMLGGPDNASVVAISTDALTTETTDSDPQPELAVEVWDPFGELQVVFDHSVRRYATDAPSRAVPTDAPKLREVSTRQGKVSAAEPQPESSPTSTTIPSQAGKASKPKAKASRKIRAKENKAKVDEERGEKVPQLLIEFPRKAS